jgi:hypothetical protein
VDKLIESKHDVKDEIGNEISKLEEEFKGVNRINSERITRVENLI